MHDEEKVITLPGMHGAEPREDTRHARKQRHLKASQVDGVLLVKRNGEVAYVAYTAHHALTYFPCVEGKPGQIQCRMGDACFTVHGRYLFPLFEDLQKKRCEKLRESEQDAAAPGVPWIETITFRLWV